MADTVMTHSRLVLLREDLPPIFFVFPKRTSFMVVVYGGALNRCIQYRVVAVAMLEFCNQIMRYHNLSLMQLDGESKNADKAYIGLRGKSFCVRLA